MFNPGVNDPGPWQWFVKRRDNVNLPIMEVRRKYMQEQLLFENYISTLNTLNTVSPSVSSAASSGGGPKPGRKKAIPFVKIKINTNFKPIGSGSNSIWNGSDWYGSYQNEVPSTEMLFDWTFSSKFQNNTWDSPATFNSPKLKPSLPSDLTIDWGDGVIEKPTGYNRVLNRGGGARLNYFSHNYATDGEYIITFTGTWAPYVSFQHFPIVDILHYPFNEFLNEGYFDWKGGAGIFGFVQIDGPNFYHTFQHTFWDGYTDNPTVDITQWDVSKVQSFDSTFAGADDRWYYVLGMEDQNPEASPDLFSFNEDISGWDVSSALSFNQTFVGQGYFNQNLGSWNVSNAQEFYRMFAKCTRLTSGARADLWDVSSVSSTNNAFASQFTEMFKGAMTDPSVVGSMPHVGNWQFNGIADGSNNFFQETFRDSGFSHTAIGQSLIGWASQSALPINISVHTNAFANTWDGSGFSNPSYDTGSAFGLEVSASYALLTAPTGSGGKGWTIPNFTFS